MMPSSLHAAVFLSLTSAVFLRVTDAAALYSSMGGLSETSGEELQHVDIKSQKWHLMARQLHKDVKTLQDEQFEKDFTETLNMTSYEDVRISTPILKHSDRCLSRNFSRERCLRRIYSVLMWYKEHLSYTERENLTSTLMNNVKHGTKRLLESINSQERDLEVEGISSTLPPVASAWMSKMVAHSILFNFTSVMMDTCRAINYMSQRKSGRSHRGTNRKRPSEQFSEKN